MLLQTLSVFSHTDNDPLNKQDPLGLRPDEICAGYLGDPTGQDLQDCEVIQAPSVNVG